MVLAVCSLSSIFATIKMMTDSRQSLTKTQNRHVSQAVAAAKAAAAYDRLSSWWQDNARDLPWRFGRTSPWGVLVSEVMSQQTPMSRVCPYWLEWMRLWPTPRALSRAAAADIIAAWGRLGYPRRALRLQECARVLVSSYGGQVPSVYDQLIALPGVGDYTASAVLSFAFGTRVPVIDTNIRRVLSRSFEGKESTGGSAKASDRQLAADLLPRKKEESVIWNQALMEVGAVICTAHKPLCTQCPLKDLCDFYAAGLPGLGQGPTRPRQKFQGTNRQIRGRILQALRESNRKVQEGSQGQMEPHLPSEREDRGQALLPGVAPILTYDQLLVLCPDRGRLDECLASLDDDGLIVIYKDHSVSLPLR